MWLTYPTTDANIASLPQWNNISLTIWSLTGLVPQWYYDGTETITASDADLLAANIKSWVDIFWTIGTYIWAITPWVFHTNAMAQSSIWTVNDAAIVYAIHEDANYIYLIWSVMIMNGSLNSTEISIIRYNKTTSAVNRYSFVWWGGWLSIWRWVWIWLLWTDIYIFPLNVVSWYCAYIFDTTTQTFSTQTTILTPFTWTTISWTWQRINSPTPFEWEYLTNTISFWWTMRAVFRFQYIDVPASTTHTLSWFWYVYVS